MAVAPVAKAPTASKGSKKPNIKIITAKEAAEMEYKADKRISDGKIEWGFKHPFVGGMLSYFEPVCEWRIPTMAVGVRFGRIQLYYNPYFTVTLTVRRLLGVLQHELDHLLRNHMTRGKNLRHKLFNVACDKAINGGREDELPEGCLFPDKIEQKMTAEQIYEKVLAEAEKSDEPGDDDGEDAQDDSGTDQGDGEGTGGGQPSQNKPGAGDKAVDEDKVKDGKGDHSMWEDSDPDEAATPVIKDITERVVAKMQGQGMGEYKSVIDEILKSKCNWRALLRFYMTSKIRVVKQSTMKHRKRKTQPEVYLPGKRRMKGLDVLVVADTSGSMGKEEARAFFGELEGIIKQCDAVTRCIQTDDGVQDDQIYKKGDWKKIGWKGGGGTDFHPLFKYVDEKGYQPEIMVFFTDGYASYPSKKPPYNVIWLTTGQKMSWGINIKLEL